VDSFDYLFVADFAAAVLLTAVTALGVYGRLRAHGRPAVRYAFAVVGLMSGGVYASLVGAVLLDILLGDYGFQRGEPPRIELLVPVVMFVGILASIGSAVLVVGYWEPSLFHHRPDFARDYDDRPAPDQGPRDGPTDAGR